MEAFRGQARDEMSAVHVFELAKPHSELHVACTSTGVGLGRVLRNATKQFRSSLVNRLQTSLNLHHSKECQVTLSFKLLLSANQL